LDFQVNNPDFEWEVTMYFRIEAGEQMMQIACKLRGLARTDPS
jgi:hypothetical protein